MSRKRVKEQEKRRGSDQSHIQGPKQKLIFQERMVLSSPTCGIWDFQAAEFGAGNSCSETAFWESVSDVFLPIDLTKLITPLQFILRGKGQHFIKKMVFDCLCRPALLFSQHCQFPEVISSWPGVADTIAHKKKERNNNFKKSYYVIITMANAVTKYWV